MWQKPVIFWPLSFFLNLHLQKEICRCKVVNLHEEIWLDIQNIQMIIHLFFFKESFILAQGSRFQWVNNYLNEKLKGMINIHIANWNDENNVIAWEFNG